MKTSKLSVCRFAGRLVAFGVLAATITLAQSTQSIFPLLIQSSTVSSTGDLNPYGVAIAPSNLRAGLTLQPGDVLVSNFNNSNNLQGTGSTIVRIDKNGNESTFYNNPNKRGPSAALGILSDGVVLLGNLPTADGTAATAQPGNLSVLDGNGDFLGTIGTIASVNGPWGMAVYDTGNGSSGTAHVFVSNVLNGTISRFDLSYTPSNIGAGVVEIATGMNHRPDPAALELGPSGVAYEPTGDVLYIASSSDNAIYTITGAVAATAAVTPTLLFTDETHLHGPLDLAILPNGHLLIANSDGSNADPNQPSELVEYTAAGQFVNQHPVDPQNGGAFGLATSNIGWGTFRLAAVDDNTNSMTVWIAVPH